MPKWTRARASPVQHSDTAASVAACSLQHLASQHSESSALRCTLRVGTAVRYRPPRAAAPWGFVCARAAVPAAFFCPSFAASGLFCLAAAFAFSFASFFLCPFGPPQKLQRHRPARCARLPPMHPPSAFAVVSALPHEQVALPACLFSTVSAGIGGRSRRPSSVPTRETSTYSLASVNSRRRTVVVEAEEQPWQRLALELVVRDGERQAVRVPPSGRYWRAEPTQLPRDFGR